MRVVFVVWNKYSDYSRWYTRQNMRCAVAAAGLAVVHFSTRISYEILLSNIVQIVVRTRSIHFFREDYVVNDSKLGAVHLLRTGVLKV